jgi:hypothetical protein
MLHFFASEASGMAALSKWIGLHVDVDDGLRQAQTLHAMQYLHKTNSLLRF